jgi:hypothetical protein
MNPLKSPKMALSKKALSSKFEAKMPSVFLVVNPMVCDMSGRYSAATSPIRKRSTWQLALPKL